MHLGDTNVLKSLHHVTFQLDFIQNDSLISELFFVSKLHYIETRYNVQAEKYLVY